MKHIEVVAAVLHRPGACFATQRGYGDMEGMWEFPGGKIEPGETPEEALHREINEELGVDIIVENLIRTVDYDYPGFHITLHCYLCKVADGTIELREHKSAKWLTAGNLNSVEWLPADLEIIDLLKNII